TQVVPMTSGDNIHTRLPHSLEVMSIAYSLGINYCRNEAVKAMYDAEEQLKMEQPIPVILNTAACVHDIGNPPFGHFGESIIKNWFIDRFKNDHTLPIDQELDFTEYDGNAQGFRVLTKQQYQGDLCGLNLTYATLAAYLKYPNKGEKKDDGYIGDHKHGIFINERKIFDDIVRNCNMLKEGKIRRHPLAFLTEAADTICYSVMDIEDGFIMNCYSFDELVKGINSWIASKLDDKPFDDIKDLHHYHRGEKVRFDILEMIGFNPKKTGHDGVDIDKSDRVKMTDLRVKLLAYLIEMVGNEFISQLESIDDGSYDKELVDADPYMICKALIKYAKKKIFRRKDIERVELTGRSVITGLLDIMSKYILSDDEAYRNRIKNVLSNSMVKLSRQEEEVSKEGEDEKNNIRYYTQDEMLEYDLKKLSPYQKLRLIVDNISGMTDKYAVSLFRELSGSKL
ncbi:MAG: dNTP triphosphohydrolase, partial [Allobaculum sp.]|nr:dNTP triphosphohydrolase [Allobaculum sp.]